MPPGRGRHRGGPLTATRRRGARAALLGIVAGAIALLSGACTTTIVPPATVHQPQPVFVLDHGRHTSLVLPHPDGLVRYAYGDWGWYVDMQTGPAEAIRAALWPTPAAIGRRTLPGTPTGRSVRQAVAVGIETLHEIVVDAQRVETLRAALDDIFHANASDMKYNPWYGLAFVPHPTPYTLSNNSNRQVAGWLRALGCTIQGPALWARWQVDPAAAEPGATAPAPTRARLAAGYGGGGFVGAVR